MVNKIQWSIIKKWNKLAKQILQFQICINDSLMGVLIFGILILIRFALMGIKQCTTWTTWWCWTITSCSFIWTFGTLELKFYKNKCQYFVHTNEYFDCLLKKMGVWGRKCLWCTTLKGMLTHNANVDAIIPYNKMRMIKSWVEWDIGRFKCKWRRLM
jgi:hypothetical protein